MKRWMVSLWVAVLFAMGVDAQEKAGATALLRASMQAMNESRLDEAARLAESAIEQDPALPEAWKQLGIARVRNEAYRKGAEALDRSLSIDPQQPGVWVDAARAWFDAGDLSEAVERMETAVRKDRSRVAAHRALGRWLWTLDRKDEAIESLEEVVRLEPNDATAHRDLGWYYWDEGRREDAVQSLSRAVALGVDNARDITLLVAARLSEENRSSEALRIVEEWTGEASYYDVGKTLVDRGRVTAARIFLQKALELNDHVVESGLYLAYSRALDGNCGDLNELLTPFVEDRLPGASDRDVDMLLETLTLCSVAEAAGDLVERIEKVVPEKPDVQERVTSIMEHVADLNRVSGLEAEALTLYERVLERDPDRASWIHAVRLMELLRGSRAAVEFLQDVVSRAGAPAVRYGAEGLLAQMNGNRKRAIEQYRLSVTQQADQPLIRRELFDLLVLDGQLDEARRQAEWFEAEIRKGRGILRSYLAEMWSTLGETEKALALWELLHLSNPEVSYYAIEEAMAHFALCRPEDAVFVLEDALPVSGNALMYEMLAEMESALGRPEEAVRRSQDGLKRFDSRGLHRYFAENAEAAGLLSPDHPDLATQALHSAAVYLERDSGYVPMNLLMGRGLESTGLEDDAAVWHHALAARSAGFMPSLRYLRDYYSRHEESDEALEWAQRAVAERPEDPELRRLEGMSLAEDIQYRKAIKQLERLVDESDEHALAVLVYTLVSACDLPGRTTVDDLRDQLTALQSAGYTWVLPEAFKPPIAARSVMGVVVNPDAETVEALDAVLNETGARLVLAVPAQALRTAQPNYPSPERLRQLADSGRWALACSGPLRYRRVVVDAEGRLGNPLTHPMTAEGETEAAYRQRLDAQLADWAGALEGQPVKMLVYPRGDYGQLSLDVPEGVRSNLQAAAQRHFDAALGKSDEGFVIEASHPGRMTGVWAPNAWTGADALRHVVEENPYINTELELAKVLYWHHQHQRAHKHFKHALEAGAKPGEVYYHWGVNAADAGAYPLAFEKLEEAQTYLDDDPRLARAWRSLSNAVRPQLTLQGQAWWDNEDRSHFSLGADADGYATRSLNVGAFGNWNQWERDGFETVEGTRAGVSGRYYLAGRVWMDADVWRLWLDELEDRSGHSVALRFPNEALSGFIRLSLRKMEMETVEAIRADIFQTQYRVATYSRLWDLWDLFADGVYIRRTDRNDTQLLYGRLVRRFREWPFFGAGYLFRFGDSDFDPDAYWAPEELQQHQLYLTLRGLYRGVNLQLSGQAGYAREGDEDWRFVWGARGGATARLTPRLSLNAQLAYFEGPIYERTDASVYLRLKF